MIDWHSHILPAIDDGSKDIEESFTLLKTQALQGVDTVIATPHFFANDESVDEFIARRDASLQKIIDLKDESLPEIICGAEVKYYQGISKMEGLKQLCIGGSKLILMEMSMSKWTEYTVSELTELAMRNEVKVILAHIERYYDMQKKSVWERLYESGILMQVNASYFIDFFTKRKALKMLAGGGIHFIGSDCHNSTSRPPNTSKAYELIQGKLGEEFLNQFNEYGYSLLSK